MLPWLPQGLVQSHQIYSNKKCPPVLQYKNLFSEAAPAPGSIVMAPLLEFWHCPQTAARQPLRVCKAPHAQAAVIWHKPQRAMSYLLLVHRAVHFKPAASIRLLAAEFENKLMPSPCFPEPVVCCLLSIFSATLPSPSAPPAPQSQAAPVLPAALRQPSTDVPSAPASAAKCS